MTEILKSIGIVEYINNRNGFYTALIKLDSESEKKFLVCDKSTNIGNFPQILVGDKVSFEIINWLSNDDLGNFFPPSLVNDISATKAAVNVQKVV